MFVTPVDSEATVLLVELRPVVSVLTAVEVEVDNDATLLLVVFKLVDKELTPVDSEDAVVAVDVDKLVTAWFVAYN